MKNYMILIVLFLFGASLMAQPKIEIEGGFVYDFGRVKADDSPLKTTLKIKNIGTELLKIDEVKAGCGCTTAPLDRDEIPPGEYANLSIELRVSTFNGDISKSIMLRTNDPEKAIHNIVLKANVVRPYSVFPRFLSFNRLVIGEESTANVTLTNETQEDFKILDVTVEPADLKVSIKKGDVIRAKEKITIEAQYTPSDAGRFDGNIILKTDNKDVPEIDIRSWGRVVAATKN